MISHINADFRRAFGDLPQHIKEIARRNYKIWKANPLHPSLRFKAVHPVYPIWSVRVAKGWRAVGWREEETIVWFWIGSHGDYDKLIREL